VKIKNYYIRDDNCSLATCNSCCWYSALTGRLNGHSGESNAIHDPRYLCRERGGHYEQESVTASTVHTLHGSVISVDIRPTSNAPQRGEETIDPPNTFE